MMQQQQKLRLIMVVCLILSTFSSLYSQVIDSKQYNYVGNWYNWQGGRFINNLNLPKVQATTGRDTGAIRYALADSSVYVWTGSQWRQVAGGSGADSSVFATRYYTQQTFVPYTGATGSVNLGVWGLTADRLVFNQAPTLAGGVGTIRWNDTDGTLEFGMKGGNVTQQIGQELPVLMRNSTGSTITNGQVVYMSGSTGTNTIVALAKADAATTSRATIGIATEDIPNGQTGFITTYGKVRDLNTTGLTEGALVYLSSTVAGGLTSTPPTGDTYPVVVGICEKTHAVNGVIFVHVDREFVRRYEIDTALAGKQGALTLTTTGSSGAATLIGNTLNVPEYAAGASGLNTVMGIDSTTTHNLVSTKAVWGDSLQFNRATIRNGLITGDSIIVQTDSVYLYGNSITAGTGASPSGLRFATLLSENLKTVEINNGVGGSLLNDWFTTTLPTVPNNRTGIRYVVLMYGTNEARHGLDPDDHRDSLEIAIDSLVIGRGYPLNKIVIATAPVMGTDITTGTDLEDVRLMAAAAKQAGLNKGTQVVDVFNYMIDHGSTADYLGSDSIHPNNTGHYAISEAITYGVNTGNAKFNGSIFTKRDIKSWGNAYIGGTKISVGTTSFADQTSTSDHIFKATTGTGYWGYNSVTNPYFYISSSAGNYFRILPTTGSGAQMGTVGSTALEIQSNSVTRQRWDASGNETNTIGTLTRTSTGMTNTLSGNSSWNFSNANSLFSITNTTATQLLRVEIRNTATSGNNNGSLHLEASGSSPTLTPAKQGDFIIKAFSSDEKRNLLFGAGNGTTDTVSIAVIPGGKSVFGDTLEVSGALVTMVSTTLGFRQPVMTTTQRDAITSPATGLSVHNTTTANPNFYNGSLWLQNAGSLSGSATLDFGSTAAQSSADLTITVTGAADGDVVMVGAPNGSTLINSSFTAWVSAADTVTVRFNNYSSGAQDPASGTFKVRVIK